MALILGNTILATANGDSDRLILGEGKHALVFSCTNWGSSSATLKVGFNGAYSTALQGSTEIVVTQNTTIIVAGGLEYYLEVASYSADILVQVASSGA